MARFLVLCCVLFSPLAFANNSDSASAGADDFVQSSQYSLGGIGLISTPTARFSDDGEFGMGISLATPLNRMFGKIQFFPWMEAVLKYTKGYHQPYLQFYSTSEHWSDKSMDVKFRLLQEGKPPFGWLPEKIIPELAVGLLDFGGTGAFSGEFIVASKRFENIDLSLGLGWGALGGVDHINNPLGWFNDIISNISTGDSGSNLQYGGGFSLGRLFEDERVSIFGGIEYFTPVPNLSVKLEYDTSVYPEGFRVDYHDLTSRKFEIDSRISAGLNYRYRISERDNIDLGLGYVHGNTLYLSAAIHSNMNFSGTPGVYMKAEELNQPYLEPYSLLTPDWQKYLTDTIMWQMGNVGFVTHRVIFNGNELQVEISQSRFKKTIRAIDLAGRILANNSPTNVDKITVINIDMGIETLRATIPRETLVNSVSIGALDEESVEFSTNDFLGPGASVTENDYLYPHFYWTIGPHMAGTLQHPEKFYFWQLQAIAKGTVSFNKGLYLTAEYGMAILGNFNKGYAYHWPDGELHHVRQNRRIYLSEGENGLRKMALDYLVDLHPNVKGKITAGYLEMMFGGVGGEVIYMPDHKQWALGFNAYWLKQRDFDQKFGFQDFETVTGFLSYYYDLPFYDMRFKIDAGRFLAKDVGVHIDISRRFDTGARFGAIVALTNCDAACVGEGSFNKWIYFEIPMDLWLTKSTTRKRSNFAWTPLTKDAGQKVDAGYLYGLMVDAKDEVDVLRKTPWSVKKILSGFSTSSKEKI
jgi:hypothetical protein